MAKVNYYSLSKKEKKKMMSELFEAVASLKNKNEAENFFVDLLTPSEFVMLSRRLQIAKMLLEGSGYLDIIEKLKVGRTTIGSVDRWLNSGMGGYRDVIKKAKKEGRALDYKDDFNISLSAFKKRYPAHFWLIDKLFG